jgi:hypothetical protein
MNLVKEPKVKPNNFDNWNRALRGAFMKGYRAFLSGQAVTENPYVDKRKECGRLTWSRSFDAAWCDGWRWARKELA